MSRSPRAIFLAFTFFFEKAFDNTPCLVDLMVDSLCRSTSIRRVSTSDLHHHQLFLAESVRLSVRGGSMTYILWASRSSKRSISASSNLEKTG